MLTPPDEGAQTAVELEAEGWRAWYAAVFGQDFVDSLDSEETDDRQHSEALEWHWESRRAFLRGERPDYFAYFPIWARGNLKTTTLRALIICDACLSTSAGIGGYALIPGGTKKKVRGTAISIQNALNLPAIKRLYPALSRVKRNTQGASQGWTADFLNTDAGYVFHFIGLEEGVAGANINDIRPTLIAPDDIDDREDSPVISEQRFQTFTRAVLPTRQANTLVYFAQNLISRYSVMYRIQNQQERVLTNRKPTVPIPAVRGLVTETRTVGGIVKDIPVSGRPTWRGWSLQRVGDEIDTYGLKAFLRECQHEVEQDNEGLVLQHYDDAVHVISRSEFSAKFGTREIPQHWRKFVFNDWARTKTKFHANVAGTVAVSGQSSQLPGTVFLFDAMSFPAATTPEDVAKRMLSAITPLVRAGDHSFTWDALITSTLQKTNLEYLISDTRRLLEQRRVLLSKVIPSYVRPILKAQNYRTFRMSHERKDVRDIYRSVFGLPFEGVNPGAEGGVDMLNLHMKVDYTRPHPFRPDAVGHSNFFIVVEDGQLAGSDAMTPDDLHDSALLRYQFQNWRYRDPHLSVTGEKEGELLKMNDDFGNGLMMLFYDDTLRAAPLTEDEQREERLRPELRLPAINEETHPDLEQAKLQSRDLYLKRMKAEEERQAVNARRMVIPRVRFTSK